MMQLELFCQVCNSCPYRPTRQTIIKEGKTFINYNCGRSTCNASVVKMNWSTELARANYGIINGNGYHVNTHLDKSRKMCYTR